MSNPIKDYSNEELNDLLEDIKPNTLDSFKKLRLSTTTSIIKTPIKYLDEIKILVCSKYRIYINPSFTSIKKHLKVSNTSKINYSLTISYYFLLLLTISLQEKHTSDFSSSNRASKIAIVEVYNNIELFLTNREFNTIEDLENLEFNNYYYKDLPISLESYKCKLCLFTNLTYKVVAKHLNIKHNYRSITSTKNSNILVDIPLSIIKGFNYNKTITYIPRLPLLNSEAGDNISLDNIESPTTRSNTLSKSLAKSKIKEYTKEYNSIVESSIYRESTNTNISKESTFFNRTTKYYKYLENKDTTILKDFIYKDLEAKDTFLELLYNLTIKLGYELSNDIESLSLSSRVLFNNTKSRNNKAIKEFKSLENPTKRTYYREFAYLVVYIYNISTKYRDIYSSPLLDSKLLEIIEDFKAFKSILLESSTKSLNSIELYNLRILIIVLINNLLSRELEVSTIENRDFNNPTITFYIIRSLERSTTNFKREDTLEKIISSIIYNSRLFTLGYINFNLNTPSIKIDNPSLFLRNTLENLLTLTSNNYFIELYYIRNKLKWFNYNRVSTYKPIKDIDNNTLLLDNIEIPIIKLKALFLNILSNLEGSLYKDLLLFNTNSTTSSIIDLDPTKIEDNKDNLTSYYSLSNNKYLSKYKDTLLERFLDSTSLFNNYFYRDNNLIKNIEEYLKKVDKFLELLLLNIYLLTSSPLRGEELVIIKYRNTSLGGRRNIYFDKESNLIVINTSYSKSRDITSLDRSNIRYLPPRLTKAIVYYLTLLRPFLDYLNFTYLGNKDIESKLFIKSTKTLISSTKLSTLLYKESKLYFTKGFTKAPYRHLITYLIKERILVNNSNLLSPNKRVKSNSKYNNNIEDSLANRSTLTTNLNYAREDNYFSNKTRDITKRSLEYSKIYFKYFNLDKDRNIDLVVEDFNIRDLDKSIAKTTSSTTTTTTTTISSIDRDAISIAPTIIDKNILDNLTSSSSSSSPTSSRRLATSRTYITPFTNLNLSKRVEDNSILISSSTSNSSSSNSTSRNRLNSTNLEALDTYKSPSKDKEVEDYLNPLEISPSTPRSNRNNIDLDLDNLELATSPLAFSSPTIREKISIRLPTIERGPSLARSTNSSKRSFTTYNIEEEREEEEDNLNISTNLEEEDSPTREPTKKGRGRPKKIRLGTRGRPRKNQDLIITQLQIYLLFFFLLILFSLSLSYYTISFLLTQLFQFYYIL